MNRVRLHPLKVPFHVSGSYHSQPDFRITRHRQGPELVGTEEFHIDTERASLARNMAQSANDTIDLRVPGVRGDQDFHALKPLPPPEPGSPPSQCHGRCRSM